MERVTDQCIDILDTNASHIRKLLQLSHEVGGTVELKNKRFQVTLKGDLKHPSIYDAEIHPFLSGNKIIDWHTHFNDIPSVDSLPENAPRMIPSDTDILTLIRASVWHNHPCVSVIISKWGYFFMTIPTRLIRCLSTLAQKDFEELCSNNIRDKVSKGAYQFFYTHNNQSLEDRVNQYMKCIQTIYTKANKEYGLYCRMVFRDLTPEKSDNCVIM